MATSSWRKSSYSAPENNCVELAVGGEDAGIRDSKNRHGGFLIFKAPSLVQFLASVQADAVKPPR